MSIQLSCTDSRREERRKTYSTRYSSGAREFAEEQGRSGQKEDECRQLQSTTRVWFADTLDLFALLTAPYNCTRTAKLPSIVQHDQEET